MAFNIVITYAGIAEIINAEHTGTAPVLLNRIGFGSGRYNPRPEQTEMVAKFKDISTFSGADVGDTTIHISARDGSADSYTLYEVGVYTENGTLFAIYSQNTPILQKAAATEALLAIDLQLTSVSTTSITFGNTDFLNPPATTSTAGVVELATKQETLAGVDTTRAVTPYSLAGLFTSYLTTTEGRIAIPGGAMIQWGKSDIVADDGTTITFPVAFNNACVYVGAISCDDLMPSYRVSDLTKTQVTILQDANGSVATLWFAIGY